MAKLGPEWGVWAGMETEEALRLMAEAIGIEPNNQNAYDEDTEEPSPPPQNKAATIPSLKATQMQPLQNEFVGARDAAKAAARQAIENQGLSWQQFEPYVLQVMAKATAKQQVDPKAWHETWWYVWGLAKRQELTSTKPDETTNTEGEDVVDDKDDTPVSKTVRVTGVVQPPRRTHANVPGAPSKLGPSDIRVKNRFENLLGTQIADEEWAILSDDEHSPRTLEEYNALQDRVYKRK